MVLSQVQETSEKRAAVAQRSLAKLLEPLDELASRSSSLLTRPLRGGWNAEALGHGANGGHQLRDAAFVLPRYLFVGPKGGDDPIRLGLFAAIHGDEPEGAHALVRLLQTLEAAPDLARGYMLFIYPVCNPGGYEDNTRHSRRGRDLNREFWNNSREEEVVLLQSEICLHAFHGLIALHSDSSSDGMYGFVRGASLSRHLLEPALRSAEEVLPRNPAGVIDGFTARHGIIRQGYQGILTVPARVKPAPFEIILESPQAAPQFQQEQALLLATLKILSEYRKFIAYAANL